jgi:hypothetical protein
MKVLSFCLLISVLGFSSIVFAKKSKEKCVNTDQGIRFVILSKLKPNKTVADVRLLDNNGVCEAESPATITMIETTSSGQIEFV